MHIVRARWARLRSLPHAAICALLLLGALPGAGPDDARAQTDAAPAADAADAAAPAPAAGPAEDAAQAPGQAPGTMPPDLLPVDLSPWGMFAAADIVVQAVMVGLALASVLTWTVLQVKLMELARARRRARLAKAALDGARTLADLDGQLAADDGPAAALVAAAANELRLSADVLSANAPARDGINRDGIKERIGLSFSRIEAAASRRMMRATGLLATIGSTAPFVGLFGTVWGIMNSFIGISEAHTTNLAVVAPGIAEALLATALGLVAAVPAVVIYNGFARAIAGYRAELGDVSAEVMRLVSRDLDRGARPYRDAAE